MSAAPAPFVEKPAGPVIEQNAPAKPLELKASDINARIPDSAAPPRKGSVRESIFSDLRKKFGEPESAPAAPAKPDPELEELEEAPLSETETQTDASGSKPTEVKPADGAAKPADDPKKKVSPWKMYEAEKKRAADLEARLAEREKQSLAPEKLKEVEDRLTAADQRRAELEQEIQFVNFQKSEKFQNEYQKPYEQAWNKAMTDLSEITVEDPGTGDMRALSGADILELVNLPLREAKALADEKFGDFASEVMGHRKDIRNLFEKQSQAIEEARKNGAEYFKKQQETHQQEFGKVTEEVKKTWAEANQSALSDEKYGVHFKPVEGDAEGNQRLSKGFELADRAFSENPLAPGLTPDQRRAIVQRHAAVRNRCAAFGRTAYQLTQAQKQIADLNAKLATFQKADPETGGSNPAAAPVKGGSAWDRMRGELQKRAK